MYRVNALKSMVLSNLLSYLHRRTNSMDLCYLQPTYSNNRRIKESTSLPITYQVHDITKLYLLLWVTKQWNRVNNQLTILETIQTTFHNKIIIPWWSNLRTENQLAYTPHCQVIFALSSTLFNALYQNIIMCSKMSMNFIYVIKDCIIYFS